MRKKNIAEFLAETFAIKNVRSKRLAVVAGGLVVVAALLTASALACATAEEDASATYKSKCAMCHGQNAEKKFDATIADDALVQIVLQGKKAEKPPNMPGFEEKGMTADQAKALVTFMKSLKQ
jgi:mono/diheme cytochrome c family protein